MVPETQMRTRANHRQNCLTRSFFLLPVFFRFIPPDGLLTIVVLASSFSAGTSGMRSSNAEGYILTATPC